MIHLEFEVAFTKINNVCIAFFECSELVSALSFPMVLQAMNILDNFEDENLSDQLETQLSGLLGSKLLYENFVGKLCQLKTLERIVKPEGGRAFSHQV